MCLEKYYYTHLLLFTHLFYSIFHFTKIFWGEAEHARGEGSLCPL